MTSPTSRRPGAAAFALLMIVLITAGWWALALWPLGTIEPEWLARTRAACFGSPRGGLPALSGWILLIGEPIGMTGFLVAAWGDALREDLRRIRDNRAWRGAAIVVLALLAIGLGAAGRRVAYAAGLSGGAPIVAAGVPVATRIDASGIALVDQHGTALTLAEATGGQAALLTFAFGHCTTVCPAIVHDLRIARTAANGNRVPILVITIDPWRDTPARLRTIATQWELGAGDRVLSGSIEQVNAALDLLRIIRHRDTTTGDVEHVAVVMAIDAHGVVTQRLDGGWGRLRELITSVTDTQT
ncbi:MAG TPA: SCO family protein [Gemmatimonadales bacterium]|nr:SCO family protein [Gemmatimonadales bacterium]